MAGDVAVDVVVVGARCAGSPLATHLAEAGLSVVVVDRATFPSDTPSTHVFQAEGIACLGRLGVIDPLVASGAPWIERASIRLGDMAITGAPWPTVAGDPGPQLCVRRHVLDEVLVNRARAAGADVHTATKVTDLMRGADGRVSGVNVECEGQASAVAARLVVGADGRGSTIGRLVGARRYNVIPNQRFAYWAYYEGAEWEKPATLEVHRWDDEFVVACPTDGGLYLVIVYPPLTHRAAFVDDAGAAFEAAVAQCEPVAAIVASGRRVGKPVGMMSYEAYFRESAGPGWVLVGDAGHFKDPAPGQGISDALRQAERLAEVIIAGLSKGGSGHSFSEVALDAALHKWWKWRDRDAEEMHWFAADMGAGGGVPLVLAEIVRGFSGVPGGVARMIDVFNHRVPPSKVLTPLNLAKATARLMRNGRHPRGQVLSEVGDIVKEDLRRRVHNRRPVYESRAAD